MALGAGRDDPVQAEVWAALRGIADRGGAAAAPLGEVFDALRDIMAGPTDPDLAGKVERLRHAAGSCPRTAGPRHVRRCAGADGDVRDRRAGLLPRPADANEQALGQAEAAGRLIDPDGDAGRVDEGVERMRAALDGAAAGHPQRVLLLTGLALAHLRRVEHTNDVAGLPEAEAVLLEARDLLRGPQDQSWSMVHDLLAQVRHRLYGGSRATPTRSTPCVRTSGRC